MSYFRSEPFASALTLLAGLATLATCLVLRNDLPLPPELARPGGFVLLYAGLGLLLWSAAHLRSAIGGIVSTPLDHLVTTGPYRLVRHPVYLGLTIAMAGVALIGRSSFGLLAVVSIFVPAQRHRAALEDRALEAKFDQVWRRYARRVGGFIPGIGRLRGRSG